MRAPDPWKNIDDVPLTIRRARGEATNEPAVALCGGKACRRRGEFAALREALERCDAVREIGCVGVCAGPVLVIDVSGADPVVLERLRRPKDPERVVRAMVAGGPPTGKLRRRVVTGKSGRAAGRRARKRLARMS